MTPVGGRGSVRPQLGGNTRSIPSQIGCVLNTRILQLPPYIIKRNIQKLKARKPEKSKKRFRSPADQPILHAALDETFFCACLRLGNKWTCACCCFSPADAATFASSPSTGTAVKVWKFRVHKLSNSARWSLCACARHCWIAA